MIEPVNVYEAATAKITENTAFRSFLEKNADPDALDRQFHALHADYFADYDCCQCTNCCSIYAVALREDEADVIAAHLGMSIEAFSKAYLFRSGAGGYGIEGPCPFLLPDGKCTIHVCKPTVCRNYPYTDKPVVSGNLLKVFSIAEECPIVYEMIEKLKEIYQFKVADRCNS